MTHPPRGRVKSTRRNGDGLVVADLPRRVLVVERPVPELVRTLPLSDELAVPTQSGHQSWRFCPALPLASSASKCDITSAHRE